MFIRKVKYCKISDREKIFIGCEVVIALPFLLGSYYQEFLPHWWNWGKRRILDNIAVGEL